jgi:hypothetical protein
MYSTATPAPSRSRIFSTQGRMGGGEAAREEPCHEGFDGAETGGDEYKGAMIMRIYTAQTPKP